ncbi:MAG: hypothetical protein OHK0023_12540 [Anaerolineae bacterium]
MLEVLAHGALGIWDEVFLILAIAIFVVMLVAPTLSTWVRRTFPQGAQPRQDEPPPEAGESRLHQPARRHKRPPKDDQFELE